MNDNQKANIRALRKKGLTFLQIAEEMRVSVNTVKSYYRQYQVGKGFCKNCGEPLTQTPKLKPKTFCGEACRQTWWKHHQEQMNRKKVTTYTCACCGREFTSYVSSHRKYCGHACYIRHRFGVP